MDERVVATLEDVKLLTCVHLCARFSVPLTPWPFQLCPTKCDICMKSGALHTDIAFDSAHSEELKRERYAKSESEVNIPRPSGVATTLKYSMWYEYSLNHNGIFLT